MKNLTPFQVANFTYWLLETTHHRGAKAYSNPNMKLAHLEHVALPEFLSKYPTGVLTGWTPDWGKEE